jgi:hypothetical protein
VSSSAYCWAQAALWLRCTSTPALLGAEKVWQKGEREGEKCGEELGSRNLQGVPSPQSENRKEGRKGGGGGEKEKERADEVIPRECSCHLALGEVTMLFALSRRKGRAL